MTLKVKVNDPHFQYQPIVSQDACLVQIYDELSFWPAKFPRILSKMANMTLKVKVNDPYFEYQPRETHDAYLMQIWWFQFKSETSYLRISEVYGRTDRRTDAGNDNTPSAWKAKG